MDPVKHEDVSLFLASPRFLRSLPASLLPGPRLRVARGLPDDQPVVAVGARDPAGGDALPRLLLLGGGGEGVKGGVAAAKAEVERTRSSSSSASSSITYTSPTRISRSGDFTYSLYWGDGEGDGSLD